MDRDPSMEQTVATQSLIDDVPDLSDVTPVERTVLRGLAARVAELAVRPIEAEKRALWTAHNDLDAAVRPLVFIDPENGWNEIVTQADLQCEHPLLRVWEMALRKEIFLGEGMRDDRVIEPNFSVPYVYREHRLGSGRAGDPV